MYSSVKLALRYIRYQICASNGKGHGIHSPFVFEFVQKVLNDKKNYPEYSRIETLRKKLLSDQTPVPVEDYGAGSASPDPAGSRSIASITSHAAKSKKYAQLLYRIVQFYQPHYIVELGTSLGISTAYLAAGDAGTSVITGEGNQFVASLAKITSERLGIQTSRSLQEILITPSRRSSPVCPRWILPL